MSSIKKLTAAFETAHAMAKSLIARQDDIVRSLGQVQKLLKIGASEAALTEISDLMSRNLKQSKERTYDQDAALRIAVQTLERHDRAKDVAAALGQIKTLAPAAFEEQEVSLAGKN